MATLTSKQLKDSYQGLLTIKTADDANPLSGRLENGLGNAITNLGIGTDSPTKALDVRGDVVFYAQSGTTSLDLTATSSNDTEINFGSFGASANVGKITGDSGSLALAFETNTNERMRIKSGGDISFRDGSNNEAFYWDVSEARLGLGTTSPSKGLHLTFSNDNASIRFENTASAKVWDLTPANPNVSNSGFSLHNVTDNTVPFHVTNGGNVGIGTTSPIQPLEVVGNLRIGDNSASTESYDLIFRNAGSNGATDQSKIVWRGTDTVNTRDTAYIGTTNIQTFGRGDLFFSTKGTTSDAQPTERMRIDSSGNVGIGNSNPSAFNSLGATDKLVVGDGTISNLTLFGTTYGSLAFADSDTSSSTAQYAGLIQYYHTDNSMQFYTGSSEAMRIDSSGNVGIGETDPSAKLEISGDRNAVIRLTNTRTVESSGNNIGTIEFYGNDTSGQGAGVRSAIRATTTGAGNESILTFSTANGTTNDVERMRINSSGNVNFNGIFASGSDRVAIGSASGQGYIQTSSSITTSIEHHYFYNPNGLIGSITTSGSSTSYNTTSDYRLKENVMPMEGALDRVAQLKPSRFNFIADAETTVDGFLAHEVAEIVPEAVTGEKDATEEYEVTPAVLDEDGNVIEEAVMGTRPIYQGIDQSKLVPLLVGAIQELRAEIEQLKAK